MKNKWMTIAVVAALATLGAGTAGAQELAGTLQKLRAEPRQELPLRMLTAGTQTAGIGAERTGQRGQDLATDRTVRNTAPSADDTRHNARDSGAGWSMNRAMGTLDCIGALDQAVSNARHGSSSRIYRAQSVAWSAQWAHRACGRVISGR